jgi:hypothetical protein
MKHIYPSFLFILVVLKYIKIFGETFGGPGWKGKLLGMYPNAIHARELKPVTWRYPVHSNHYPSCHGSGKKLVWILSLVFPTHPRNMTPSR